MSTAGMMKRIAEASPRPSARITGAVYLLYFLTAALSEFFMRGIVVDGDAAATANNILAHQPLFRLGRVRDEAVTTPSSSFRFPELSQPI